MPVEVVCKLARAGHFRRRLGERGRRFLAALGRATAHLSILVVGDGEIRRLNRKWRGVDRATDVLSFPLAQWPGNRPFLGDVVISMETAARRARQDGRPIERELDRYLAHGLLHLLGYDHERSPEDASRMAKREQELIGGEGLIRVALRRSRGPRASGAGSRSAPGRRSRGRRG